MILAAPAVFMPLSWMDVIHGWLGLGRLPQEPIVSYLARSVSAFYAMAGALALYVSFDVERYWRLIAVLAVELIVFGATFLAIDVALRMPAYWVFMEGPCCIALGGIVLWLQWLAGPPRSRSDAE
jgi:hypothetical protein